MARTKPHSVAQSIVFTPHPASDLAIKALSLGNEFQIVKLAANGLEAAVPAVALLARTSWINKNQMTLRKLFVLQPTLTVIAVGDEKLVHDEDRRMFTVPVSWGSTKAAQTSYAETVQSLLFDCRRKLEVNTLSLLLELDDFSRPFLELIKQEFEARNSFLLLSERSPDTNGFQSLGHDLYFRSCNPCDFEITLQHLDRAKKEKKGYHVFPILDERFPEQKLWIGLETEPKAKVTFAAMEQTIAPLRGHLVNVLKLQGSHSKNMIDDLTGLYNQRYLHTVLEREIGRARRQKNAFALLFLDVDRFKLVNDTKGHWTGSKTLSALAGVLKSLVRTSDYCFRYGGDEFVIVLSATDQDQAGLTAERIRQKVEMTEFDVDGLQLKITVSIGVALYPNHADSAKEIVKLADQAMYYSKRNRNSIHITGT